MVINFLATVNFTPVLSSISMSISVLTGKTFVLCCGILRDKRNSTPLRRLIIEVGMQEIRADIHCLILLPFRGLPKSLLSLFYFLTRLCIEQSKFVIRERH